MATAQAHKTETDVDEWTKPPFLRRVRIQGYKSIAFCDVALQPLTILVGRNASGKSNFLDALAFLRDVLEAGTVEAVHRHGGRQAILPRIGQRLPSSRSVSRRSSRNKTPENLVLQRTALRSSYPLVPGLLSSPNGFGSRSGSTALKAGLTARKRDCEVVGDFPMPSRHHRSTGVLGTACC